MKLDVSVMEADLMTKLEEMTHLDQSSDCWMDTSTPTRNTEKLFKCPTCGKIYLHQRNLSRHVKLECGKEPMFQCPYCPHRSKRKFNIKLHIRYKHKL
ncbi:hypothetical protein C0J52_13317 [Blattella germanica]|nr:hypothetical protein C0J52_13317 [Blattella germanica]